MSIGFRIAIVLVCAYAGWQTGSVQFAEPPVPQHLTPSGVLPQQALAK
jgi:hypothetical protein